MLNLIIKPIHSNHIYTVQFLYTIFLLSLFLGQELIAQDLVLQNMSVSTVENFSASNSITAGPNFKIINGGDATLTSKTVTLNPGCSILRGGKLQIISSNMAVGVESENEVITDAFLLHQNYPNPFNPSTIIKYQIPTESLTSLKVFDILGKEVAILVNEKKQPGVYEVNFNASELSSGIYFYQLKCRQFKQIRKMILMR